MKRTLVAAIALVAVLTVGPALSRAEDQAPQGAAPAAAPADTGGKAVEGSGGCMPDGSCCGQGACAGAAAAEKKGASESADTATGGCPCAKMKKKPM